MPETGGEELTSSLTGSELGYVEKRHDMALARALWLRQIQETGHIADDEARSRILRVLRERRQLWR